MKYGFKYNSNSSFKVVPATDSAGYNLSELRQILQCHYENELQQLKEMNDEEFLRYYAVVNEDKNVK